MRINRSGFSDKVSFIPELDILAKMGYGQRQGYFISKPMPADQFLNWIETWAPPQDLGLLLDENT